MDMNQTKKIIKIKKTTERFKKKNKRTTPKTPPPPPYAPPKCDCESDDDYSVTESGCDKLNCPSNTTEVCPPVNKKAQRTFVNLGIDPKTAERFKVNDTCDRCGHFFKRGMIKEYHYTSKNCMNEKPYSETEKGMEGKGGEHTARKARKAADPTRELTKAITAWHKKNELRGIFTYKDDKDKQRDWHKLHAYLYNIPAFLREVIANIEDFKRIFQTDWGEETNQLLGKISEIELDIVKAKTTVSLGGVELGAMGGGEEKITLGTFLDWEY